MDLESQLVRFRTYLLRRGLKRSTIYRHITNLKRLHRDVSPLTPEKLENFLLFLLNQGKSGTYINVLLTTAIVWGHFTGDESFSKIKNFPENPAVKIIMSDKEIEDFLNLKPPQNRGVHKQNFYHWTKFFKICAFTGMRPGEVANLTIDQTQLGLKAIVLYDTKTHTPRNIPIPDILHEDLIKLIDNNQDGYLFPSKMGGTGGKEKGLNPVFSNTQWNYNFNNRIDRLGIKRKGLTLYSLRHSFITRLLEEDVNLFKVQKIVGHRQIATTAAYTHLTLKDIQQAIKKHPLIRKQTDPKSTLRAIKEVIQSFELDQDSRFTIEIKESGSELNFKIRIINLN